MNILNYIGNTPLVKLKSFHNEDMADIYIKLESMNPGGSIKSRVALRMIEDAERSGRISPGMTLLEPTGGNTGVGFAIASIIKGYKFIAVVPDNYSTSRINLLKLYNSTVILSNSKNGGNSHIDLAKEILHNNKDIVCLDQFRNHSSVMAHYDGTSNEILKHLNPDAFVSCVGSGGTFTGSGLRLKEKNKNILLCVAQPKGCDILKGTSINHNVQGVSIGIIPPLMDYTLINEIIDIECAKIKPVLNNVLKTDGILLGISSGANILAAIKIAHIIGKGKRVCTVAPDGGQYYLEEIYKEGINENEKYRETLL